MAAIARIPRALFFKYTPADSSVSLSAPDQLMLTTRTPWSAAQIVALYISLIAPLMLMGSTSQLAAPATPRPLPITAAAMPAHIVEGTMPVLELTGPLVTTSHPLTVFAARSVW